MDLSRLWQFESSCFARIRLFFLIALSEIDIENYYRTNFALIHHYGWSLYELENMMPYEYVIYKALVLKYQQDLENQKKEQNRRGF